MHIIGGTYKHRKIIVPKGSSTRPTSSQLREALFNICQNYIEEARFLDLFAGSGAIGVEALSRGAVHATFIDNSKESIRCIKKNLEILKLEASGQIFFGDVFSIMEKLNKQGKQYDIIYADPPYGTWTTNAEKKVSYSQKVVSLVDVGSLLVSGGSLFVEDARAPESSDELRSLKLVSSRAMGPAILQHYKKL